MSLYKNNNYKINLLRNRNTTFLLSDFIDSDLLSKRKFMDSDIISEKKLGIFFRTSSWIVSIRREWTIQEEVLKKIPSFFFLGSGFFKEYFFLSLHKSSILLSGYQKYFLSSLEYSYKKCIIFYNYKLMAFPSNLYIIESSFFNSKLFYTKAFSFPKEKSNINPQNPMSSFLEKYHGEKHRAFIKGLYFLLYDWDLKEYIALSEDYRTYFFADKTMIYKGTFIEIPLMLKLESKMPANYSKKSKSYIKKNVDEKISLGLGYLSYYYYFHFSEGGSFFLSIFFLNKNAIFGVFREKRQTKLWKRVKNIHLFLKFSENHFEVFSKAGFRIIKLDNHPFIFNYFKRFEYYYTKKGKLIPNRFFRSTAEVNFDLNSTILLARWIPWDTLSNIFRENILLRVSQGIQRAKRIVLFRSKFTSAVLLKKRFGIYSIAEHYIFRNTSESRILNWFLMFGYNNIFLNTKLFYKVSTYFPLRKKNIQQFSKPEPFFKKNILIKDVFFKNWLPSDQGFLIVKSWARKVHIEERTIDYKYSDVPIFKEPEPLRIFLKIMGRNSFSRVGRSMGSGFYNSFLGISGASSLLLKVLIDAEKSYNPSLPFKKKKKKLSKIFLDFISTFNSEGYVSCSTRSVLRTYRHFAGKNHIFLKPGFILFSQKRVYAWQLGQSRIVHPGLSGLFSTYNSYYFNFIFQLKFHSELQVLVMFYYFICMVRKRGLDLFNFLPRQLLSFNKEFFWLDQNSNYLTKFLPVEKTSPKIGNIGTNPNSLLIFSFFIRPVEKINWNSTIERFLISKYSFFFYNIFNNNLPKRRKPILNPMLEDNFIKFVRNPYFLNLKRDKGIHLIDSSFCGDYSNLFSNYQITLELKKKRFFNKRS